MAETAPPDLPADVLSEVDEETRALLQQHGFEELPFAALRARLLRDGSDPRLNHLQVPMAPPPPGTVRPLPPAGSSEEREARRLGEEAIARGEVGVIVLNGGMATRFGEVVKGAVRAMDGRSFLELKIRQVARVSGGRAPVLLMNSFATHAITLEHLRERGLEPGVSCFEQYASLRLRPDGQLFRDAEGRPSLHATGHGDLPFALNRSGALRRFIEGGGRWLTVSNVDNLAASLDPVVIGAHRLSRRAMTVELVSKDPQDPGGLPALVGGRVTVVEGFRIPPHFDLSSIGEFSTNNFVFDAQALVAPRPLEWFVVSKRSGGSPAVQFERLVNQLADTLDTHWLRVPRQGIRSRFLPIKLPSDFQRHGSLLREVLDAQGVLED